MKVYLSENEKEYLITLLKIEKEKNIKKLFSSLRNLTKRRNLEDSNNRIDNILITLRKE